MKTEHLLIMRFSSLGDVMMVVPVVKALAEQYPDLRITVLSRPFAKVFFDNLAPNVNFMGADTKNEYKHVTGLNELYKRLTAKNFTIVADLHGVLRTEYLRGRFMLDGIKVFHIDKHRKGRKSLCRLNNKILKQQPSPFQNYADVLQKAGYPIVLDMSSPPLHFNREDTLRSIDEKWIGIAPIAAFIGKSYPLEKTREVIKNLYERHPKYKFYIFGTKPEEFTELLGDSFSSDIVINVSEIAKGFDKELLLMNKLDVMVSMDSANMHLASLIGLKVISIWGQTHPYAGFMGWGQSTENAIQLNLDCRPCSAFGNKPCAIGDFPCIKLISPQQIVDKIENQF